MRVKFLRRSAVLALILLVACSNQKSESGSSSEAAGDSAAVGDQPQSAEAAAGTFAIAGVRFEVPDSWEDLGAGGMRQAQYRMGPVEGDAEAAEVNVFFFGPEMGGDIESNIRRWVGQMKTAEGEDAAGSAVRSKLTTNGFDVHFVEVDGTYMQSMGGGPMTGGRTEAKEGYRMVAAIVEAPGGNIFIKLTGPGTTAREMEEGLREMIGSVQTTDS